MDGSNILGLGCFVWSWMLLLPPPPFPPGVSDQRCLTGDELNAVI